MEKTILTIAMKGFYDVFTPGDGIKEIQWDSNSSSATLILDAGESYTITVTKN